MRIAEIYQSIQGEGRLTGTESVFVRTSGCNLRCWFCDTPFASWNPEGSDLAVEEIVEKIESFSVSHVVITGGEPMLFAELIPLCSQLRESGKHITIETAGTLHLALECDLMSISPKLANSAPSFSDYPKWHRRHLDTMIRPQVIRDLIAAHDYQVKFVVDQPDDLVDIESYLEDFPELDRDHVMLMPQGTTCEELDHREQWLEEYCRENDLQYCPRKQIHWYGFARGT